MLLFDDANGNTLRDEDELLLAGGSLTVSNASGFLQTYSTDGATEPHCFPSLTTGEYIAAATPPGGYAMTTIESLSVMVDAGADLDIPFGATGSPSDEVEVDDGDETGGDGGTPIGRILLGVSGLLVLAVAGGLGVYFLIFRRT